MAWLFLPYLKLLLTPLKKPIKRENDTIEIIANNNVQNDADYLVGLL